MGWSGPPIIQSPVPPHFTSLRTLCVCVCLFVISWAAPSTYGGSQARCRVGAVATGLRQNHSNAGSEPCLQPTPQLTATPGPQPTEQGQGPNRQPLGSQLDSLSTAPRRELLSLRTFADSYKGQELGRKREASGDTGFPAKLGLMDA